MPDHRSITRIAVVIVNYRGADMVIAGLDALVRELGSFERAAVIVVDNASPGDDADRLERAMTGHAGSDMLTLVRSPVNGGFSAGNNAGFRALDGLDWSPDAIMLLNPDATVQPGAIQALARTMAATPRAGLVGACIEDADGTRSGSAFHFPSIMGEFARSVGIGLLLRRWPTRFPEVEHPVRVDWVSGAAVLLRAETLRAVGPMDEGYFLYFEEVDYMLQARRAGWETWYDPTSRVTHLSGAITGIVNSQAREGPMPAYWFESWRRYFTKNHGAAYSRVTALGRLLGMLIGILHRRARGKPYRLAPRYLHDFTRICLLGRGPAVS